MTKKNIKTKDKILLEGTLLFCKYSYNQVTIKEISMKAACNIAAINYHFKDKKGLYLSIIEKAYLESVRYFNEETENLSCLEKIDAFIDTRLDSALAPLAKHSFSKLINQEIQSPSAVHGLITSKYINPMVEGLKFLIKEYLGLHTSPLQVQTIAFTIKSLCVGMHITMSQDNSFWQPHDNLTIKNEIKQFIISSIVNYKKQIGNQK